MDEGSVWNAFIFFFVLLGIDLLILAAISIAEKIEKIRKG